MVTEKALWPGWETVRMLGRGSFGTVYEIERDIFGHKEKAALKVISIPQSYSDIEELLCDGYDVESITSRFEGYMQDIVREYSMMADMKGCANIVYCDDWMSIRHDDGMGWDIFIKMELLSALPHALGKTITDEQVIKIGTDICNALVFCENRNLLHRDIKPGNIFVTSDGVYKLGEFKNAESLAHMGVRRYMAPEVYNNQPYGTEADIYSLGLVLYWLLNERRPPFFPLPPEVPNGSDAERAMRKRLNGELIPEPLHGSKELKQIVLKACAFDPSERYQTAGEMLAALWGLQIHTETASVLHVPIADAALLEKRGLFKDGSFTDSFFALYRNYRTLLDHYLKNKLHLHDYDDRIANSSLRFIPVSREDMDYYQSISTMGLKYIYLRNEIYVEKLSEQDVLYYTSLTQAELRSPGIKSLERVRRTYTDIIDGVTGQEKKDSVSGMSRYGPDSDRFWFPSDQLVFGIRHDEFADNGLGEDEAWMNNNFAQTSFINGIIEQMSAECSRIIGKKVNVLLYDEFTAGTTKL